MHTYVSRVLKAVGALATGVLVLVAAAIVWVWWNSCGNVEQQRVSSPDGKRDIVVFERDCGATTDFSTQVSIIRRGGRLPHSAGNTYIYGHRVPIAVAWQSKGVAEVRYPPGFRGLHEWTRAGGVSVRFLVDSTVMDP